MEDLPGGTSWQISPEGHHGVNEVYSDCSVCVCVVSGVQKEKHSEGQTEKDDAACEKTALKKSSTCTVL